MSMIQIIFVVVGAFTILMGVSNIGINSRKMQRLVRLVGEIPTRIIYIVIGITFIVLAFVVDLSTI